MLREVASVACLSLLLLSGCGSEETMSLDDREKIESRVRSFLDYADDPVSPEFKTLFVGKVPSPQEIQPILQPNLMFDLAEEPDIDGDQATAQVQVIREGDHGNQILGTAEWTLQKVDDRWLLKSIAFPPGL